MYKSVSLSKLDNKNSIPNYDLIKNSCLKKGNLKIEFEQSEIFLLFDYLRKGVVSKSLFKPRFSLHTDNYLIDSAYHIKTDYEIATDGRHYKFSLNEKSTTIDIGFNFYDINAKNWVWKKKTDDQ